MMGPNAWLVAEELTAGLSLKKGMRVLYLGCGRGLTSVFLAEKFGVQVFAVDLWTSATENYDRFKQAGVYDRILSFANRVGLTVTILQSVPNKQSLKSFQLNSLNKVTIFPNLVTLF